MNDVSDATHCRGNAAAGHALYRRPWSGAVSQVGCIAISKSFKRFLRLIVAPSHLAATECIPKHNQTTFSHGKSLVSSHSHTFLIMNGMLSNCIDIG